MLWAKLKTNNGRRGPTALQTFVQEFGILVGRSLVRADADDWKIPILLYNSDPCTKKSKYCKCNPVIIPARTRIARVEEIQAIQNIVTRETEHSAGECILPPHLLDVLDTASELTSDQHAQPTSWPNTYTRFRPLRTRSQVERRRWYTILILDPLDRYVAIQGNYRPRKLRYNKN